MLTRAQQRVLDVATRMYAEAGYAAVSQRQLAGQLDIQAPSLYSLFPTQSAILEAVCTPYLTGYSNIVRAVPLMHIRTLAKLYRDYQQQVRLVHFDPAVALTSCGTRGRALDLIASSRLAEAYRVEMHVAELLIGFLRSPAALVHPDTAIPMAETLAAQHRKVTG